MLLGASHFLRLLKLGSCQLREALPDPQETQFSWVVAGDIEVQQTDQQCYNASASTLFETMKRFWKPSDQEQCEKKFLATHRRDDTGREGRITAFP